MFKPVKKMKSTIWILTCVILCLSGCGGYGENDGVSAGASAGAVSTGTSVSGAASGAVVSEKKQGDSVKNAEQITIGREQIALRQGEEKNSMEVIRIRNGNEEVLASFNYPVKDCHIEPFRNILGYDGFRFFVKEDKALNPYGAEVYYVGLTEDKAKILFENHAKYEEKSGKYSADFEEEIKDLDGDGVREVVSNISFVVDGGHEAVVYDCKDGQVYTGGVLDLFDLEEDEYYVGRAVDLKSWYNSESKKVTVGYLESKKPHRAKEKTYTLDLSKIEMEENITYYVSDELKDLGKYEEVEEEE